MLDPGKRKCKTCYEERDKFGIQIPNCLNPDGDGIACQYPIISNSLDPANLEVLYLWEKWADQLIQIEASLGGAIFTLNSAFLQTILTEEGISDRLPTIVKMAAIFREWRAIQMKSEKPKTDASFKRLEKAKKLNR